MNYGRYSVCYRPLSTNDIEAIHKASMLVLEKTASSWTITGPWNYLPGGADFEKKIVRVKKNGHGVSQESPGPGYPLRAGGEAYPGGGC